MSDCLRKNVAEGFSIASTEKHGQPEPNKGRLEEPAFTAKRLGLPSLASNKFGFFHVLRTRDDGTNASM